MFFTFSAENPRGSLQHKAHMAVFSDPDVSELRIVDVNHCAYGGYKNPIAWIIEAGSVSAYYTCTSSTNIR